MISAAAPYAPPNEAYLPFQLGGIQEILLRPHVLLADEMGLGKTIEIIGYLNLTRPKTVLVVCPNNLRLNWLSEIDKWLEPTLRATYDIEQCTTGLLIPTNFVLASYEGLTRWALVLATTRWDVFVLDEAHYIKNSSTKRARAVFQFRNAGKKILATGTPICNYPYELFPLINFLDQEQWPSVSAFQRRYCPYANKYGYHLGELQQFLREGTFVKKVITQKSVRAVKTTSNLPSSYTCATCSVIVDYENDAIVHVEQTGHEVTMKRVMQEKIVAVESEPINVTTTERAIGLMIRRLKKEVLPELPRKRRQIIELPAEGELLGLVEKENALWQQQYEMVKQLEMALELESKTDDDFAAMIESMKFNRQYFFQEIALIRHALAVAKVPYVCEHIEDLLESKDKLVCFVHHNDVAEAIFDRFRDRAVLVYGPSTMPDRQEAVQRFWTDEKCELFIGSLKVTGLGINLQVASNIVFAELDWVPGVITQAEDRCHRIGQDKSLLVQHLVAQNSMDSNMAKRIVAKQKSIQKALNRQESGT